MLGLCHALARLALVVWQVRATPARAFDRSSSNFRCLAMNMNDEARPTWIAAREYEQCFTIHRTR
jgi:hypothetical protein